MLSTLVSSAALSVKVVTLSFAQYTAHRDLHSFPTRRSSDLHGNGMTTFGVVAQIDEHGAEVRAGGVEGERRSEEHTSELQSLRHLVCRLLLEKKKDEQGTGNG